MIPRLPRVTRMHPLFPHLTLFRSLGRGCSGSARPAQYRITISPGPISSTTPKPQLAAPDLTSPGSKYDLKGSRLPRGSSRFPRPFVRAAAAGELRQLNTTSAWPSVDLEMKSIVLRLAARVRYGLTPSHEEKVGRLRWSPAWQRAERKGDGQGKR